jgi:hypothetical protein
MLGGKIPVQENCCTHNIEREKYIKQCIPLYNMINSNKNFFFEDDENKNTYTIFHSTSNNTSCKLNQINANIECIDKKKINPDDTFDNKIDTYIDKYIVISNIQIPLYYMYINNDDIFNIFLSSENKIAEDIFRFTDGDRKFVGMSLTFNIFNFALFSYIFFDVLEIFFDYFNLKHTGNKELKNFKKNTGIKLDNIFKKRREYVENMHDLSVYKKKIITKNIKLNDNVDCEQEYIIIRGNYDSIIQALTEKIYNLADFLYIYSKEICCEEYKYMFLMSILSYRLKNKLITGGWGFSIKKTIEQLDTKIIPDKIVENVDIFIKSDFPPIYEYSMTTYKGKTYGNCMENTILQFFKVLFWDKNKKIYDLSNIANIIKEQYVTKFKWFFDNINNEKDNLFIDEWTDFITFDKIKPGYDFVRNDIEINSSFNNLFIACHELFNEKNINVDTLENKNEFIKKNIDKINLYVKDIEVNSEIGTDIVKLVTEKKIFQISLRHGTHAFFNDAVRNTNNEGKYIILNNISVGDDIYNTIEKEKKIEFDKDILQYILVRIMFYQNKENNNQIKLFYYINKNYNDLISHTILSIYSDLRSEYYCDNYSKILISKNFLKKIGLLSSTIIIKCKNKNFYDIFLNDDSYFYYWDNNNWENAFRKLKDNKDFWIEIAKKDNQFFESWKNKNDNGNTIWADAHHELKDNKDFWIEIAKKDNQFFESWKNKNNNKNTIWDNAFYDLRKNKDFWIEIAKKDNQFFESWKNKKNNGNTTWSNALYSLKDNKDFWIEIAKKDNQFFESWKNKNDNGNTIWSDAHYELKDNKDFWIEIAKKDNQFFESWKEEKNDGNIIWAGAIYSLKDNKDFWIEIAKKDNQFFESWKTKNDNGNTIWAGAFNNLKENKDFWIEIAKKDNQFFESWKTKNDNGNTTWGDALYSLDENEDFWIEIAKKDNQFFESWKNKDNLGDTIWTDAFYSLDENKDFWIEIAKKDNQFFESWKDEDYKKLFSLIKRYKVKNEFITDIILNKNLYEKWNDDLLINACRNLDNKKILNALKNNLFVSWNINRWENFIMKMVLTYKENIDDDKFWEIITKKDVIPFQKWNSDVWNLALDKIYYNEFWKHINVSSLDINEDIKNKISLKKSQSGGQNYKNKYIKYLKKNIK